MMPINFIELEADYFASNLLMPTSRFKQFVQKKKFDFSLIDSLTKKFETSISATLLKFIEVDSYPIMVVFSKNNMIVHYWYTFDFPYKFFIEHSSKKVPPWTVAGDYFNHGTKCEDTEIVDACEWFSSFNDISGVKFFEKCIYRTFNNSVISIIWQ